MLYCKCGKVCYDRIGAMLVVAKMRIKKSSRRMECRYYKCELCKKFHITSMKEKPHVQKDKRPARKIPSRDSKD